MTLPKGHTLPKATRNQQSVTLLWLALGLAACTEHTPVPPPDIKMNPTPKERYEITMTIEDAPASLQDFMGRVHYTIDNYSQCIPVDHTRSLGGSRPMFEKYVATEFRRVEGNIFKAGLVDDLLLNENYYELGVCRWKASGLSTKLDRPQSQSSRMGVGINRLLIPGHIEERYCLKGEHVRTDILGSCPALEGLRSRKEPREWFYKVTIEARRN